MDREALKTQYEEYKRSCRAVAQGYITFDSFVSIAARQEAWETAKANATPGVYARYVAQARDVADEDEARAIVKNMQRTHEAESQKLYEAGEQEALRVLMVSFQAAKEAILAPYKGRRKPCVINAINVYDDDDQPTTHRLVL